MNESDFYLLIEQCAFECNKNPAMLTTFVKENIEDLSPEQLYELCRYAIMRNPKVLPIVPKPSEGIISLKNYKDLCRIAETIDSDVVNDIPKPSDGVISFHDYKEIWIELLKSDHTLLAKAPKPPEEEMQAQDYKDFCMAYVSIFPREIDNIPLPPAYGLSVEDHKEIYIESIKAALRLFDVMRIFERVQKVLPAKDQLEFFLAAIKADGENIKFIPKFPYLDLTKKDYQQFYNEVVKIFAELVEKSPNLLGDIPSGFFKPQDYKSLCLMAVKRIDSFKYVPHPSPEGLTRKDYVEVTKKAIKNGLPVADSLPKTSENKLELEDYKEIFRALAVEHSHEFKELPSPDESSLFTWKDYVELWHFGVKCNMNMIANAPMDKIKKEEFEALWITAVRSNSAALSYMDKKIRKYLGEESYVTLCRLAVLNNTASLQFMKDDDAKTLLIKDITPEKLLLSNYSVYRYFPGDLEDNKKEAIEILSKHLGNIEHVVVTDQFFSFDSEINDSYSVYKTKREGKTIRVINEDDDVQELLDLVKAHSSHKINLVLLSHAHTEAETLSGLSIDDMLNVIKTNPNISRVTLFGCRTAQAEQFEQEKAMQARAEAESTRKFLTGESKCGFLLADTDKPDEVKLKRMLASNDLQTVCILCKPEPDKKNYPLIIVKKDTQENLTIAEYTLDSDQVAELQESLNKKKAFLFPKEKGVNKVTGELSIKQRQKIIGLCDNLEAKFMTTHKEYQKQKELYPLLGKIMIKTEAELAKLQDSLQKKLVIAIRKDPDIKPKDRPAVKGYIKLVQVDPEQMRFHGTSEMVYGKQYFYTFFNPEDATKSTSNIARDELKKDREASMAKGEKTISDEPPLSDFKAVIVELSELEDEIDLAESQDKKLTK